MLTTLSPSVKLNSLTDEVTASVLGDYIAGLVEDGASLVAPPSGFTKLNDTRDDITLGKLASHVAYQVDAGSLPTTNLVDGQRINDTKDEVHLNHFSAYVASQIAADVPTNTVAPVVSGDGIPATDLTTTDGTWTHSPTDYSYQWFADDVAISGETADTYTVVIGDVGKDITCKVTAANGAGSATATSNAITVAAE